MIHKFVTEEGVTIFRIEGKLIPSTVDLLRKNLENVLQRPGCKVVLTCNRATVLDSLARDELIRLVQEARRKEGRLVFAEMPPAMDRLMRLPEPKDLVQNFRTEEEAVQDLT